MVRFIAPFVGAAVMMSQLANGAPAVVEGAAVIVAPGSSSFSSGLGSGISSSSLGSLGSSSLGSLGSSSLGSSSLGSLGSSSSLGSLGSSSSLGSLGSSSLGSLGSSSSLGSLGSSSSLGSLGSSGLGSSIGSTFTPPTSPTSLVPPSSSSSGIQFGSGSSGSFNAAGFGTCVAQCVQQFGVPSSSSSNSVGGTFSPTGTSGSVTGTGVTKTVIVAPTAGVLRFVPFAVNASVGDTVRFIWGAGPHTVTKSSELTVCNATLDTPFTSGRQNASFSFEQQVTSTDPTFFFCGVPTHCQKGMFGIINPPSTFNADLAIGQSIQPLIAANPALEAAVTQSNAVTAGTSAANWGSSISVQGLSPAAQAQLAENVMFTRMFYAQNPGTLEQGLGANSPTGEALNIPVDPVQQFEAQNPDAASTAAPEASSPAGGSVQANLPSNNLNSGSSSLGAQAKGVLAVVSAAAAAFFVL